MLALNPVWSVVANVVHQSSYGTGGLEKRSGTKHFAAGAKVFPIYFFWGMAGERVKVVGHHRKSHRFIYITMPARHLANWRTELVYSPYVIRRVWKEGELLRFGPGTDAARLRAEEIAAGYIKRGAVSQPYITRSPAAE